MHVDHCSTVFLMSAFIFFPFSSILNHMLRVSSFLHPHGCWLTAVVSVSEIEKELLFFYPLLQCHKSLSIHFLLASIVSFCVLIYLYCVTSPALYMTLAFAWVSSCLAAYMSSMDVHTDIFTNVLMVLTFIFIPVIPGLCSLYGCSSTASQQCTSLGQVCI